ncbi:MAG: glucosamine-6-phosphate deaminase [Anaerolineae bacterium]
MPVKCEYEQAYIDQLSVKVFPSGTEMGICAADDLCREIKASIGARGLCYLILATGNSQLPIYEALRQRTDVDWYHVEVFHMDEYLGLQDSHPASFRRYMHDKFIDFMPVRAFYEIEGDAVDPEAELERYSRLLRNFPADVCVLGIGENGHLAFNDPPADFTTSKLVHIVTLDQVCRQQQVGEGHFSSLADVPTQAMSLTIPALLAARKVMAIVPEKRKAEIVRRTLTEPVSPWCPATILRQQAHATLYLDNESSSLVTDLTQSK